jgi:hypothetical protein
MLVEAAWAASKTPGPLRAFYERVRARRGKQIATVACARKLAELCWHLVTKDEDYALARPSLTIKMEFPRFCGVLSSCGASAAGRMDADAEVQAAVSGVVPVRGG